MIDIERKLQVLSCILTLPEDSLPVLDNEKSKKFYRNLQEEMEKRIRRVGTLTSGFQRRKKELQEAIQRQVHLANVMSSHRYIRPLLSLWLDPNFGVSNMRRQMPSVVRLFDTLDSLIETSKKRRVGLVALSEFCLLFFMRYSFLRQDREAFGQFVRKHLSRLDDSVLIFKFGELKSYSHKLFSTNGHIWLGEEAERRGIPLADMAALFAIPKESEIYREALAASFIRRVEALAPNESDKVLRELLDKRIYEAPWDEEKNIGHVVLSIMIDKLEAAGLAPTEEWKDIILYIAKDPRMPETSASYRLWWSVLGQKRIDLMRSWRSRFDMKLFLALLEEYTKLDSEMHRMFETRKAFLEEIFRLNEVSLTRLFLGAHPESFLKKKLGSSKMPFYTKINQSDLTAIYYHVGSAHVIEGTHSFAMRIFDAIPSRSSLRSYKLSMETTELRTTLDALHQAEFGKAVINIRHHMNGEWMKTAVRALSDRGVKVSADIVRRKKYTNWFTG